ncbi:MAG: sporulation protein YunB [Halanaerobiales bacterium]|nr:sporulation protein YunB [Halanaerobiales bacterium]
MRRVQKEGLFRFLMIIFFISIMLGAACTFMIESFLRPVFLSIAEEKGIVMATNAINSAVFEHAQKLKYTDLIHYQTNQQGDIILMQPNLQIVNEFVSEVTMSIQHNMEELREEKIHIPIAQALGFQIFASIGPKLTIRMHPLGVVRPPEIVDTFESVGLNQTRHKIYLDIKAEVQIIVPFLHNKIEVNTQVPVTEVIIMGKVPEVYVGIDGGMLRNIIEKTR